MLRFTGAQMTAQNFRTNLEAFNGDDDRVIVSVSSEVIDDYTMGEIKHCATQRYLEAPSTTVYVDTAVMRRFG